jgi:hypothetical protein
LVAPGVKGEVHRRMGVENAARQAEAVVESHAQKLDYVRVHVTDGHQVDISHGIGREIMRIATTRRID